MYTINNDLYNEAAIKEAEKRTDRFKSKQQRERIKKVLNSKVFKDLDFPPDEDELDDGIKEF